MKQPYRISRVYPLRNRWLAFQAVYCCLARQAELKRLVQWARRKRLPGPERAYRGRLTDGEARLAAYTLRHPGLVRIATGLFVVNNWLVPPPRYCRPGSARAYRR